jgi:drug/metabolite transporter (DMT)-like permease
MAMSLSPRARGVVFAQLNALCAGTMMAIGKEVTVQIPPQMFIALMYAIVVPVNTAWWLLTHFKLLPGLHAREENHALAPLQLKSILWLTLHAGASVVGIIGLWEGLTLASAAAGSLLSRLEVVVAIVLGLWLLREQFTRWHWLGFGLTAAGMVIVRWAEFSAEPVAFLWLMQSALGFGLAEFSGKVAVRYWPVPRLVVVRGWLMCTALTVLWWIRVPGWPWEAQGHWPGLTGAGWGWLVASALLGPVLARNNYMLSLSYLPVSQVVLLNQAQPLYAALVGFWLRAEIPAPLFYLGGLTLIAGNAVLILAREAGRRREAGRGMRNEQKEIGNTD